MSQNSTNSDNQEILIKLMVFSVEQEHQFIEAFYSLKEI
jgi:hypothetical protein